ncbi:MAG TPA: Tudor-knot domain-containing protein [Rubricoccaceae bacterium]|jgi:hypothetical protein
MPTPLSLAPLRSLPLLGLIALAGCSSKADHVKSAPPGTHFPAPERAAPTGYAAGQAVHIDWEGTWYAGHVVEVGAGATAGQYKIHYDGWADSWDEWVTPEKLRLPSAGVATGSRPGARS